MAARVNGVWCAGSTRCGFSTRRVTPDTGSGRINAPHGGRYYMQTKYGHKKGQPAKLATSSVACIKCNALQIWGEYLEWQKDNDYFLL